MPNYNVTSHELANRLLAMEDKPVQFYHLVDNDLRSCNVETILDMDVQVEISIMEACLYCGGGCHADSDFQCDGYAGDIDGLYSE